MRQRRLTLLVGALALLSVMAYLTGVFDPAPTTISVPDVEVPVTEVTSISIASPSLNATLSKDGGVWKVTAPISGLADSLAVNRLLDSVGGLELLTVVSTNRDRHARYGVDTGSASLLNIGWGGESIEFQVAAQGPGFGSSYVRLDDGTEVYTTSSGISIPNSLDQLRDKTLTNLQVENVIGADVTGPDYSYRLRYGISGWSIAANGADPVPADSTQVVGWLRRFAPLRMDGFLDDRPTGSVLVSHSLRFAETSGATHQLFFGVEGDTLAAFVEGSNNVLRTFGTRLTTLVQSPDALTQSP